MEDNYFSFRGNFYKQTKGAATGNPLSPFLSELFMANFESILKNKDLLPQRWWRYVDDVFSIIRKDYLPKISEAINSIHKDIKFTPPTGTEPATQRSVLMSTSTVIN